MFTKQHYEFVARLIDEQADKAEVTTEHADVALATLQSLTSRFADEFGRDNPLFNRQQFTLACGWLTPI